MLISVEFDHFALLVIDSNKPPLPRPLIILASQWDPRYPLPNRQPYINAASRLEYVVLSKAKYTDINIQGLWIKPFCVGFWCYFSCA